MEEVKTLETPTNLTGITKSFMLEFMKTRPRDEIDWFKDLCASFVEEQVHNVTKETFKAVNIKKLRRAFAEKYFPQVIESKKKKKSETFLDLVNAL